MGKQFPPNSGKSILQQLAENASKRRAEQAEQAARQEDPTPQGALVTVKPNTQEIGEKVIQWTWNGSIFDVDAKYFLGSWNNNNAGDYKVDLIFDSDVEIETKGFDAEKAREIGIVMLSAYQWSTNWQQHVGEFLVVKPSTKPDLQSVDGYESSDEDNDEDASNK